MELSGDDSFEPDEKVEPADLIEECWFFDNLLDRRRRMSRCYSDPCTSSTFYQEMLVRKSSYANIGPPSPPCIERKAAIQAEETNSETSQLAQKPPSGDRNEGDIQEEDTDSGQTNARPNLLRTPSLPPCVGTKKAVIQHKESSLGTSKLKEKSSRHALLRTPSMPPCVGREGIIQHQTSKVMTQRHRPPRKQDAGSMSMDVAKEMRRRFLNQTKTMRKSLSDLEFEEVQGFKDLGFTFEREDLSPSVVSILPGLQDKDRSAQMEDDNVKRPYLSEAWLLQCSAPPIPNWVGKSSAPDMKAQIKFWARAVASNVRQEC